MSEPRRAELKPCPFCGGAAHLIVLTSLPPMYQVAHVCKVVAQGAKDTAEEAIEAWNTRAERTCRDVTGEERIQAFTCSECGCWVAYDEYWETGIYVQTEGQPVHIHPHYCPNCGAKVVE